MNPTKSNATVPVTVVKMRPYLVRIAGLKVQRTFEDGESYTDTIPNGVVMVPTAASKRDAIAAALPSFRKEFGIPAGYTLNATAIVAQPSIGDAIDSKSNSAIIPRALARI